MMIYPSELISLEEEDESCEVLVQNQETLFYTVESPETDIDINCESQDIIKVYDLDERCIRIVDPSHNNIPIGWSEFGQDTPKQISVGTTSILLLSPNPKRVFARFSNNMGKTVFIQYGIPAVYNQGFPICNGSSYIINTTELYLGPIYAITLTGTTVIDVVEGVL